MSEEVTDFSWSYSAYSSAVSCLRKFKYCYVDKIVPEGPDSGDLIFGSALHAAINSCLTDGDGLSTFEIYWESYKLKKVEYGRHKWEELSKMGAEFIRKFIKYHAPKYSLEFAETRLFGEYRGVRLEGTPDYYGVYNGVKSLRDFKTSGRNYEEGKGDCALQLYLYAYLYLTNNPTSRIDTLGYTVFNKGTGSIQDLTWDFSEVKMYQALDNMIEYTKTWGLQYRDQVEEYPMNLNSCYDYNRKCIYWDKCHKEIKE